jgi:DHA3 family tetracycline resistance protein-like MFS transporter
MFSVSGQVDAIGQIVGGPGVGLVGNLSIRAALLVSALLLSPVVPLYQLAIRRTRALQSVALKESAQ